MNALTRLAESDYTCMTISQWNKRPGESAPKIGADDAGSGIAVCHINGPDAGAGADVEDVFGLTDRCAVQLAIHQAEDDLMVQIQPVLLHLYIAYPLRNRKRPPEN